MKILSSEHNSRETAFVIDDYPFGRTLRCFKRIWVETKKNKQRIVYQTTKRSLNHIKDQYTEAPVDSEGLWNADKKSTYDFMSLLVENGENGYIENRCLSEYAQATDILEFKEKYGEHLDSVQKERLDKQSVLAKVYIDSEAKRASEQKEPSCEITNYS